MSVLSLVEVPPDTVRLLSQKMDKCGSSADF